jgi:hypothetical protein
LTEPLHFLFGFVSFLHAIEVKDMINGVMTLAQIEAQYKSEWILLENPRKNRLGQLASGRVIFHSKNRDEVYRKAIQLRLKRSGFYYTGKIPKGTAVIL